MIYFFGVNRISSTRPTAETNLFSLILTE